MLNKYTYLLFLLLKLSHAEDAPIVQTKQGLVRGLKADDGDYYKYLGIPFGVVDPKNPFGAASVAPTYEGVFNATDASTICPQIQILNGLAHGSLDCLKLNIYVPSTRKSDELLPILVWIYGGGFLFGFSEEYGPQFLMPHDVIMISFNYRVACYGFMCTRNPRVPGNEGLKDQVLALRWIQENIEHFGGDPNKTTISGNSAGAVSADLQIIRNSDERLFQQVILQSGSAFLPDYSPAIWDRPLLLAKVLGFNTEDMDEALDFLTTIDPLELVVVDFKLGFQYRPCVEMSFDGVEPFVTENWVPKDVITTAKGLNIMIGFNINESHGVSVPPGTNITNVVEEALQDVYLTESEEFDSTDDVRHFFFGDDIIDNSKFQQAIDLRSDLSFIHTSMLTMYRYLKSDVNNMFLYLFSYDGDRNLIKSQMNSTVVGAVHADEQSYLYSFTNFGAPTERDQIIVDRMTELWTNFVKYGDPTPEPSEVIPIKWRSITPSSPQYYMHIGTELETSTSPLHERIAFWDIFHETYEHLQRYPSIA